MDGKRVIKNEKFEKFYGKVDNMNKREEMGSKQNGLIAEAEARAYHKYVPDKLKKKYYY